MKVKIEKTFIEECEITFPVYAMRENDDSVSYVKITEDEFFFLEEESYGLGWKLHKQKFRKSIPLTWYENACKKEVWLHALKRFKEYEINF